MNPFKSLRKFLLIEEDEDEVVEEEKTEMKPVKPEVKPEVKAEVEATVEKKAEPIVEKVPEVKEVKQNNSKKLSEIVPSAETGEVKRKKRRVHIDVNDFSKKEAVKTDLEDTKKYESTPIISPIYGMTEKDNSRVVLATKPESEEPKVKGARKTESSVLDTIISPIFGTNISGDVNIGQVEEKTKVYNNINETKKESGVKNDFSNEKLSLDDILETPSKKVMKKSKISQNMTIFDEDLEEKE